MEPSQDTIIVRLNRLNELLLKKYSMQPLDDEVHISNDTLLDAILVLYDECDTDHLKSLDLNIAQFVDLYRLAIVELKRIRINISDFEVKTIIGRGHFGDVHVVKEKQTGDIYAMKTIRKTSSVTFVEEKSIMTTSQSPWITALQYTFQDCNNLYFVMEYHSGGDLLGLIYRQGGTIPETAATFYIAELVLALNDLHKMGFVHRDIKPDNILLDRCGHLKLTDFGSAAKLDKKGMVTNGLPIGTPDYISPEVLQCMDNKIKDKPTYGTACDYWSLGILSYELIVGNTPFSGQNTTVTYSKIMAYANRLKFPAEITITQGYAQLLHQLIHTNVNMRLSYPTITKHAVFQHFDFNNMLDQVPPYVPYIKAVDDTSNFSDIQIKASRANINIDNFKRKTQFSGKHLPFLGFTYVNMMHQSRQLQRVPPQQMIKDELVENLKKEVQALKKKQSKSGTTIDDWEKMKSSLERNIDEKTRKLESVETVRDRLERDLATALSESSALKRTLELERKDRSELEVKALDIIKSTKSKWEVSEKIKLDALRSEIGSLNEWIEKLRADNALLTQELQNYLHESRQQKKSIEKVDRLRRHSVVGLENRLEKVTNDTQLKISFMQSELCKIANEKLEIEKDITEHKRLETELRNQITNTKKQIDDMKLQNETSIKTLKEYEQNNCILKTDNAGLRKNIYDIKEQITRMSNNEKKHINIALEKLLDKNVKLETELKQVNEELSTLQMNCKEREQQLQLRYENEVQELQNTHSHLRDEHDTLRSDIQTAKETDEDNKEKVRNLEELLARLANGVTRLENGSNGEQMLQEQIKRLEENNMQVHEKLALEKHEHLQLKSKFWRLEKDLTNAELDRKIVERDLKDSKINIKSLNANVDKLGHQIKDMVSMNDSNIANATSDNRKLQQEIENLRTSLSESANELLIEQTKIQDQKMRLDVLREEIQTKDFSIASLRTEFDQMQACVRVLEKQVHDLQEEKASKVKKLQTLHAEHLKYDNEVVRLNQEIDNHVLNRGVLREACTIFEEQLVDFERIYNINESKRTVLSEQLAEAHASCASLKNELQQARRCANENKSLLHFAEVKAKRAEEELSILQQERDTQSEDIVEYKRYATELTEELSKTELKLRDCECSLREYERQLESGVSECNYLKEENSLQRTVLSNVKNSNYRLEQELLDMQTNANIQSSRIKELERLLSEEICYHEERDLKNKATIQQQTKLIDFLQSKIEESKKKKTLSDKLFGHSRKENVAPPMLNHLDLETKLAKEREQTLQLRTEIVQLRFKLQSHKSHLESEDTLLNVIGHNQINNSPHLIESKVSIEQLKCVQCGYVILLGQRYTYCSACTVTAHTSCAARLPPTCGSIKHNSQSVSRLPNHQNRIKSDAETVRNVDIKVEGWIKIPIHSSWEKHYACLTANKLNIYGAPPNEVSSASVQTLELLAPDTWGKVVLEPVASEIVVPVANSDLPFVLKVDVSPSTSCWPPQSLVFMTLNVEDKNKWFNALDNIFKSSQPTTDQGDVIFKRPSSIEINLISEFATAQIRKRLLCTMSGLYAISDDPAADPLHIGGPLQVHDISFLSLSDLALMVVDEKQVLIQCDLNSLKTLMDCASCTAPTLKYISIPVVSNNECLEGFRMVQTATTNVLCGHQEMACAATDNRIVIMAVEMSGRRLQAIRVLDTAEPTSCMLFTELSLLIGADKFFEVTLRTLESDEFLDNSDYKLLSSVNCYKLRSFPIAIVEIIPNGEYLIAFNEFGVFVDQLGCSSRKKNIIWNHLPRHLHYVQPYLYVVQFSAVEISKITSQTCKTHDLECLVRLELNMLKFLGGASTGIYVENTGNVRFISARHFDDDESEYQPTKHTKEDAFDTSQDRFSFTSSMVRSLDGNLSDNDSDINGGKKVQFATETDL